MADFLLNDAENQSNCLNWPKTPSNENLKSITSTTKDLLRSCTPNQRECLTTPVTIDLRDKSTDSPFTENFIRSCRNLENEPSHEDVADAETVTETDEQRRIREDKESELLAWEMMRQENLEIYQMQMQFMEQNANEMSEDDYNALQLVINESGQQINYEEQYRQNRENDEGSVEGGRSDGEDEEDGNESDDPDSWDYERLLELGQAIGDVKTERWRLRAKKVMSSLPVVHFREITAEKEQESESTESASSSAPTSADKKRRLEEDTTTTDTAPESVFTLPCSKKVCSSSQRVIDHRCAVCMEHFEAEDELNLLPCQHYFHIPCTEGWLADHNSCPTCKAKISATP